MLKAKGLAKKAATATEEALSETLIGTGAKKVFAGAGATHDAVKETAEAVGEKFASTSVGKKIIESVDRAKDATRHVVETVEEKVGGAFGAAEKTGERLGARAERLSEPELHEFFKQRTEQIRESLPKNIQDRGNLGIARVEISGVPTELRAHSRINYVSDKGAEKFVLLREQKAFPTKEVNNANVIDGVNAYDRMWDTESKILEEVSAHLGEDKQVVGRIDLFTERRPCASCSDVITQFKKKYPNVEVNVYDLNR